jgi:hypothetical protein
MRLQRHCLIALALTAFILTVTLASGSAQAGPDDPATAVLGLETQDVAPRLADEIAELLRQNVASSHDLRLGAGRDLVELKLVFSCADEGSACMAQAGRSLNVDRLIYGSIKRSGDGYVVWLKLFDVKREKIESWVSETVPKERLAGAALKPIVTRWFYKLRGRGADMGTLRISAEVAGAVVSLDGVPAGATSDKPVVLTEVPAGRHDVTLAKPGYGPTSQTVSIAAGQVLDLKVELRESPSGALGHGKPVIQLSEAEAGAGKGSERDSQRGPGAAYRVAFWVSLAAGVASAGGALKFGLDVKNVNQDLDPYRRYPCTTSPTGICNAAAAPATPLTAAERSAAASLTDKGNRDHALQWVCIGVGSALGIASGYFLYKGYLSSEEERSTGESSMVQGGLRIFPAASASSGGVLAEFDF